MVGPKQISKMVGVLENSAETSENLFEKIKNFRFTCTDTLRRRVRGIPRAITHDHVGQQIDYMREMMRHLQIDLDRLQSLHEQGLKDHEENKNRTKPISDEEIGGEFSYSDTYN